MNPHVMLQETTASNEGRTLLDDSSTAKGGSQAYITYRSCISVNTEKLSVLGFEVCLCLFKYPFSLLFM